MNHKEMEYILAIAKTKSISKAAIELYMTQPALSVYLSRLEAQLGTTLFIRSKDGLTPTYAGEKYIEMARQIMTLNRGFEQDLCEINAERLGRMKVGTSAHIGSYILPDVIPRFNQIYPNIEIEITEGHSQFLENAIADNELDIALMHLPLHNLNANYEEIKRERYVMAFSRNSPLASRTYHKIGERFPYIDPREARDEKYILAFPHQRVRQISDRILAKAGVTPNIRLTSSSVQTALRFAGVGMGVTFLPESYINLFNMMGDPVFCYLEEEFEAYWTFVIVYPKEMHLTAPEKEFIRITRSIS